MIATSTRLSDRLLAALATGARTTGQLAKHLDVREETVLRHGELLLAARRVERSVKQHWCRAPEEGWAEWVWRLP